MNELQWYLNINMMIFYHENAFENVICKMGAILSNVRAIYITIS